MRLLYLYPEEWTGRRAREVHTLSTCAALAQSGVAVTLLTAGGLHEAEEQLRGVAGATQLPGLQIVALSRSFGPIRSAAIFKRRFHLWRRTQPRFDWAYIIHLKAAAMLVHEHVLPYAYEAHEIFAQTPQKGSALDIKLHELERKVLIDATVRIATSAPLAAALSTWFALPNDSLVAPNAGQPPLPQGVSAPDGPFLYAGSIARWKGIDKIILASRDAQVPLKIVGGTAEEWQRLGQQINTSGIDWNPRVPLADLPAVFAGARVGLIPTDADSPSGKYSCPMKLFDYARCGLPVITAALPSLQSLDPGSWCVQVTEPTREGWAAALRGFAYDASEAESARAWAGAHTWARRAELLVRTLAGRDVRR
jgi:glycosyltransferase involved in cell wall biosynthesis